ARANSLPLLALRARGSRRQRLLFLARISPQHHGGPCGRAAMFDFLTWPFDTSDFPPRWHCGSWSGALGWLHILSDLGVWSAYVAIPCVLGYFLWRRKDLPFRTVFLLFGAFIL